MRRNGGRRWCTAVGTVLLCGSVVFSVLAIGFPAQATTTEFEVLGISRLRGGSVAVAAAIFYGSGGLLVLRWGAKALRWRVNGGVYGLLGEPQILLNISGGAVLVALFVTAVRCIFW